MTQINLPHNLGLPVLLALVLLIAGCSGPEAKFTTDKSGYNGGDTVRLKSASTGSDSLEWFLGETPIGTGQELQYVLEPTAKGPLTFKLKATVDGGPSSVATQTVMATTPIGTVTAWSTFAGVTIVKMSDAASDDIGTTSTGYTTDPGCGAEGCITMALSPGTYTIDGASSITRTRRIVDVQPDACVSVKMH